MLKSLVRPVLVVLAISAMGCMHTRRIETTSVSTCGAGCYPSSSANSTYSERNWTGFWFGQPARVQP